MSLVRFNPFKLTRSDGSMTKSFHEDICHDKPMTVAPTVGLSRDGFEFLNGSFEGLKGYTMGQMTKSRRGKLYIDNAGWSPEVGSIEYGYRVPFGGIHVFIGKIGEPGPELDICTDIIETAQRARSAGVSLP